LKRRCVIFFPLQLAFLPFICLKNPLLHIGFYPAIWHSRITADEAGVSIPDLVGAEDEGIHGAKANRVDRTKETEEAEQAEQAEEAEEAAETIFVETFGLVIAALAEAADFPTISQALPSMAHQVLSVDI
jgi:hypothetical protein